MNGPFRTLLLLAGLMRLRIRRGWQLGLENNSTVLATVSVSILCILVLIALWHVSMTMFLLVARDAGSTGVLPAVPERVLAVFLALGGGLGFMTAVFRANDVLYLRSDLDLAMALPLDTKGIMLARTVETALTAVPFVAVLTGPATAAYAWLYGAWYAVALYPLFVLAPSVLASAAAVLLMTLFGRLAATTRAREAMGLIGSIIGAVFYVLWLRFAGAQTNLIDLLAEGMVGVVNCPATSMGALAVMPAVWPALVLHFLSWGPVPAGLMVLVAGVSGTACAVWLLSAAGATAYVRGLGLAGRRARRSARPAGRMAVRARGVRVGAGVLGALIRRDWAILTRSPRLWQPMAMPVAWAVYMLVSARGAPAIVDPLLMGALPAGVSALTGGMLASMSFGVEGSSFYHVSSLPVSPRSRVVSKIVVFALPPAVLGLIVVGALFWGTGLVADGLRAAVLVITSAVTMTALAVMMTVGDVNFEAVNPREWQSGSAGCASVFLMGIIMVVAFVALRVARELGALLGIGAGVADTVGVALLAAVCLGALVPGAIGRAAEVVKARSRSSPPPTWG